MNFLTAVSRQMTRFTALIIILASIIAFSQKTHDIGRNAARAGADQNQTQCQSGRKIKGFGNANGKQWHNRVLGDGADKNIERTLRQNLIIFFAQSHANTEHDDAEYDDLRIAFYP